MSELPVRVAVYVQPRASKTGVAGMHGTQIKIRIAAAPVDNAANVALIEFVANRLGIAKRQVRVAEGLTSRRKTLEIDGVGDERIAAAFPGFTLPARRSSSGKK